MTTPGTRRPREGRCVDCDRPLSDVEPNDDRGWPVYGQAGHCMGGSLCEHPPIDWRQRALDAEAALATRERCDHLPSSSDTRRLHRIRDALFAAYPPDGEFGLSDDVQRLNRALQTAFADGHLSGIFEAWCRLSELAACTCNESWTLRNLHSPDCTGWLLGEIEHLATEADDGIL